MDKIYLLFLLVVFEASRVATGLRVPWQATSLGTAPRKNCVVNGVHGPSPEDRMSTRVKTHSRVKDLRQVMKRKDVVRGPPLDAYIITSDDEHQSEAVASRDQRRQFISGFSGSQGDAVITINAAALWIDARYYMQADSETACFWLLMRNGLPGVPTLAEWLAQQLKVGARVGADPRLIANHVWVPFQAEFAKNNLSLIPVQANLIDVIWTQNRPRYPRNTSFIHSIEYAGETWMSKVQRVRGELQSLGAEAQVITALDEVAWLLNIRGRDIPYTPVVRAYVILALDSIDMYIPGGVAGMSDAVRLHLRSDTCFNDYCVRLHEYEQIWTDLKTKAQAWSKVLVPSTFSYSQGASHAIYMEVGDKQLPRPSPVMLMKAVKNKVEIQGMRRAHIRDAAAICFFMAYLEEMLTHGKSINESDVASHVDDFRLSQPLSEGASFRTIAAYGPNGAMPHYRPRAKSAFQIKDDSTLVLDSGGQYLDGTTDVTRTFHFGKPSSLHREAYTRVLAGHLNLARLVFPANVDTTDVDVLARQSLWSVGMDYLHSTGHGIGIFLSVHEPPININYNNKHRKTFEVGHFFSDEPGYYQDGNFGVRLENVLEVVNKKTKYNVTGPYLAFRSATLVPYEPKLINIDLLTPDLRKMLNEYNARVRIEVGPELKKNFDLKGFRWMMNKTGYVPEWIPPKNSCSVIESVLWLICLVGTLYYIHFT